MPQLHNKIRNTGLAALYVLIICVVAGHAEAKLFGEVELGYTSFTSDKNDVRTLDANSFIQRYSMFYANQGKFAEGRMGRYSLALGYEWASFDTTIKTPTAEYNPSINAGHMLYNGEILIRPRELPFRLSAYSRNMGRTGFQKSTFDVLVQEAYIINPEITTSLNDGLNISSGATLMLGVKNGLTNGYNSVFKELPMIYVDYRDEIQRDTKSQVKVDSRLSKLAFVSLNKKDNWFHYRTTKFEDYINSNNNRFEEQYQLGTVDHTLMRQWITLTNWVRLSVDGVYTKRQDAQEPDTQGYELNLFTMAVRDKWEGSVFNTFNRYRDSAGLHYYQRIPVLLNGVWNQNTDWRVRTEYNNNKSNGSLLYPIDNRDDLMAQTQITTFKNSPFNLTTRVALERIDSLVGHNIVADTAIETVSTPRFSRKIGLGGGYSFTYTESDQGGDNSSFYQHTIRGNVNYMPIPVIRFRLDQSLITANGTRSLPDTSLPTRQDFNIPNNTGTARLEPTTGFVRSNTTLTTNWTPVARLGFALTASEDYYKPENGDPDYFSNINGVFDYTVAELIIRSSLVYQWRDVGGVNSSTTTGLASLKYAPYRTFDAFLEANYSRNDDNGETNTSTSLRQVCNYRRLSKYGLARPDIEITEEISYWRGDGSSSFTGYQTDTIRNLSEPITSQTRFSLRSTYYPLRHLYLKGSAGYSMMQPSSQKQIDGSAGIGVDYQKLKASVDYSYGRRDGVDKRVEKRLMANLKKFF